MTRMQTLPLRLPPGADLRLALQMAAPAAFVLAGIGSLSTLALRLAGADEPTLLQGDFELLTLSGSLSPDGAHLHASVADAQGRVLGGPRRAGLHRAHDGRSAGGRAAGLAVRAPARCRHRLRRVGGSTEGLSGHPTAGPSGFQPRA